MRTEFTEVAQYFLIPGGLGSLPPEFQDDRDTEEKSDKPVSFPIDPDPDDTKSSEDLPISFPIDPDPDDTKSGGS